jgi:putative ABC transport system permease protein
MRRNLTKMWTQFLSVFLMALLGILIYSGLEGLWNGMQSEIDRYFTETNLSSAWIYGKNLNNDDVNQIRNISGVTDCSSAMTVTVKTKLSTGAASDENQPDLKLTTIEQNNISKLICIEGTNFSPTGLGIWIDSNFAKENNLQVGDKITLEYSQKQITLEIKGLVQNAEYIYYTGSSTSLSPNYKAHGYATINQETAKSFFGGIQNNEIRVKLTDNMNSQQFQKNVESTLGEKYMGYADRDCLTTVSTPIQQANQIKKMGLLFSSVFILLALLCMQTAMTRLVNTQRVQIGTLKALGYHDGQIRLHYALYGLTVGLLGGIAGLLLAPVTITPIFMNTQKIIYALPNWHGALTPVSYLLVGGVGLCCTIATLYACRKGLKGMPAETMRGLVPKAGKQILLEKSPKLWSKISFAWKWSLRDIARSKIRAIMGIIGVLGCMMLLIASFGMQNSIDYANDYVYHTQYTYGTKVALSPNATSENRNELGKSVSGSKQWIQESAIEFKNVSDTRIYTLTAAEEGNNIHFQNLEGISKNLPDDGVFITRKIADNLKIKSGEPVEFRLIGEREYVIAKVTDIVDSPTPQGIFTSNKVWQNMNQKFNPNTLLIGNTNVQDQLNHYSYVQSVSTVTDQLNNVYRYFDGITIIFTLLKMAAILLGVVILYNLGILSYTERTREYATLKVLGFYQKEVRSFALRENILTTIFGWILGIPVGLWFLSIYVQVASVFNFDWQPKLSIISFLIGTAITIGCSIGVNLFISQKVKKINMVEALKSVE